MHCQHDDHNITHSPEIFYSQILRNLNSGVIVLDTAGTILTSNPAAAQFLNTAPENLESGKNLLGLENMEQFGELLEELKNNQEPIRRREIQIKTTSEKRVLGLTASPLMDKNQCTGIIVLFTDLTKLRQLEHIANLNKQLAQIGELTAGVVHELRSPISVISFISELMLRQVEPDTDLAKKVNTILNETIQMEMLIRQFLGFARPFELDLKPSQSKYIIRRALELTNSAILEKEISINESFNESDMIYCDDALVAQALGNILSNAVDAVKPGGEIWITSEAFDEYHCFRIEDDGPGLNLCEGDDIFSAFYSKKEGGTGLGLSIVHRIITAHGGTVTYGNRPENGAFFEIHVPHVERQDI